MTRKKLVLSLVLLPALVLSVMTSCSDSTLSGNSNVSVLLTDAPIDLSGVSAVIVTLTGVSLHTAEDDNGNTVKLSLMSDGDTVRAMAVVAEIQGNVASILKGERTALNFMQRLSGIATATAAYVSAVEGLDVVVFY